MSLIFCDGAEDGLGPLGKYSLAYSVESNPGGRNGNCYRMYGDYGNKVKHQVPAADEHATFTIGCAIRVSYLGLFEQNSNPPVGLLNFMSDGGATQHVYISFGGGGANTSPTVAAFRGAATLLGSAALSPFVANQWYYLEAQVVLHDTTGSVTVKVNGTTVLSLTNIDTKNSGTKAVFDSFQISPSNTAYSAGSNKYEFDDIYVTNGAGATNNGFLGDIAVETLFPSGDGSSSQWVGSDGNSVNNSLLVDEAGTPNTTDYVQSGTSGNKDTYALNNLARASGTVYGMMVSSYAQNTDSGPISIKNAIKSGATNLLGAAKPLVTTYTVNSDIVETDPNTTSPWTVSGINAVEVGVEVV